MKIITINYDFIKEQEDRLDAEDFSDLAPHQRPIINIKSANYDYDIEITEEDYKEFRDLYDLPEDEPLTEEDYEFVDFLKEKYEEQAYEDYCKGK